jgi:hypothetical protein
MVGIPSFAEVVGGAEDRVVVVDVAAETIGPPGCGLELHRASRAGTARVPDLSNADSTKLTAARLPADPDRRCLRVTLRAVCSLENRSGCGFVRGGGLAAASRARSARAATSSVSAGSFLRRCARTHCSQAADDALLVEREQRHVPRRRSRLVPTVDRRVERPLGLSHDRDERAWGRWDRRRWRRQGEEHSDQEPAADEELWRTPTVASVGACRWTSVSRKA